MSHKRFNPLTASSSDEDELETPIREIEDSSSDEETDSDSDSELGKKDEVVTEVSALNNQESKSVKISEKSVAKRSRETHEAQASADVKKAKKVKKRGGGGGEEAETKKAYFQRVWTDDDEIVVLEGFIDYKNDSG